MKFGTPRNKEGKFLVPPLMFIWYLLTSAMGIGIIFSLVFVFIFHGGIYFPQVDMIMFYGKDYSADELHYIANHEIGHHVWFQELTEKERKEYINIYENSNIYITTYSEVNVVENFAEEYAFYRACTEWNNCVSKDRVKFFQENIYGYKIVLLD